MTPSTLPILQNPAVAARTSVATQKALEERAEPAGGERYLPAALYATLQLITQALLPQDTIGTAVDVAAGIDKRLRKGTNAGWRFADLPADGDAYKQGLIIFAAMLAQTPTKRFSSMLPSAREGYLRCVANGDVDAMAEFPLSRWLGMVKADAVKVWLAHPSTMQTIEYYGFADGATGQTDGPTEQEGWSAITPDKALPFEQGIVVPTQEQQQ